MKLRDFDKCKENFRFYGGDGGTKFGIMIDDEPWIVKFPKSTADMQRVELSYTTSPASEYIGSQIYESLGIDVHKTLLGTRNGKVVVACKDFLNDGDLLIEFKKIKNAFGTDAGGSSSSGASTDLDEIIDTINRSDVLKSISGTETRLWETYVVDSLIGNNDRHNMNWGVIRRINGDIELAPVYDNGGSFFNKRGSEKFAKSLNSANALAAEALNNTELAFAINGKRIHPFTNLPERYQDKIISAMIRIYSRWDKAIITNIIMSIPESHNDMLVLPPFAKEYYLAVTEMRLEKLVEIIEKNS